MRRVEKENYVYVMVRKLVGANGMVQVDDEDSGIEYQKGT